MLKSLLPGWFRGPLTIDVSLEDRSYELGETIRISVELSSIKDVEVAGGRVDLMCEEKWAETYVKPESMGRSAGMIRRGQELPGPSVPVREVKEFKKTFAQSTAEISKGLRVHPETPSRFDLRLDIDIERPPHAGGGTLTWSLVTTIETAQGRTVTDSREVTVVIPS
jgi:hypothetical protein